MTVLISIRLLVGLVFEQINSSLFQKCLQCVEQVLMDSKVSKSQVDEIVLVGGTTRIPKNATNVK